MKKYNICINYDYDDPVEVAARQQNGVGNYMVPWLLEKAMKQDDRINVFRRDDVVAGQKDGESIDKVDLVINSMPLNQVGFIKNDSGLTAWWDLEECSDPKTGLYQYCDIVFHPNYNPNRWNLYERSKASYLPLANDMEVSRYFPCEQIYDFTFLGRDEHLGQNIPDWYLQVLMEKNHVTTVDGLDVYKRRRRILDNLGQTYNVKRDKAPRGEPSAKIISQGKLTIQISGWDNLEERFFQFGAIRPIMVDYLEEIDLVAEKDKEYISYSTDEECYEKAKHYLSHMNEAEEIGNRLIERIKKEHTYKNRVDEIIRVLETGKLDQRGYYLWEGKHD